MKPITKEIIAFDALDTIQGYKGADPGKSKPFYQEHVAKRLGMRREEMLETVPLEEQLWLTYEAIIAGNLEPIALPGTVDLLKYVHDIGRTPVIITADIPQAAAATCSPFTEAGLVQPEHVAAIHHLGRKSDITVWQRARDIWFPKSDIVGVFEDSDTYAHAAAQGLSSWSYLVRPELTKAERVSTFWLYGAPCVTQGPIRALHKALEQNLATIAAHRRMANHEPNN